MMRKNLDIVKIVADITLSVASFVESKQIELIFDTDVEEMEGEDIKKSENAFLTLF